MDPPDVEMEATPEPPVPAPAPAAAGEGWSMLSRARALLQEGKPSLALQAVRPLPVPPPFRLFECCVVFVPTVPGAREWGILWVRVSYATHRIGGRAIARLADRGFAVGLPRFDLGYGRSRHGVIRPEVLRGGSKGGLGAIRSRPQGLGFVRCDSF